MRTRTLAPPLANFLNRLSLDREVRRNFEAVVVQSKLACDVVNFAHSLGYGFAEADLYEALRNGLLGGEAASGDMDLRDDALDGVTGGTGAGVLTLPKEVCGLLSGIQFGSS